MDRIDEDVRDAWENITSIYEHEIQQVRALMGEQEAGEWLGDVRATLTIKARNFDDVVFPAGETVAFLRGFFEGWNRARS